MKIPSIDEILFQLKEFNNDDLSQFHPILKKTFKEVNPIFMKREYVDFFWHCATTVPGWISQVVLSNSEAESEGSKKLLDLWKSTIVNKIIEDSILYHAKDESRHSHLFVKLVSLAFEDDMPDSDLKTIKSKLTKINRNDLVKDEIKVSDDELLDHLIQMNMGEIRTLVHMHFLGPVIFNLTPKANKEKVFKILQGLAKDEVLHIGYTSKLIDDWCKDNNYNLAYRLYYKRLEDFHKLTISQTEYTIRQYGNNKYPMLLEI